MSDASLPRAAVSLSSPPPRVLVLGRTLSQEEQAGRGEEEEEEQQRLETTRNFVSSDEKIFFQERGKEARERSERGRRFGEAGLGWVGLGRAKLFFGKIYTSSGWP